MESPQGFIDEASVTLGSLEDPAPEAVESFRTFGFVVLRRCFEPGPLAAEIDRVLNEALVPDGPAGSKARFQYVPMMTLRTPVSLTLLDRLGPVAAALLGGDVLPTRAKAVRYHGDTPWHADSALPISSVGFLAYLESVGTDSGALRVLPGSHHPGFGDAIRAHDTAGRSVTDLPSHVVATEPGDVIALDEHLFHASFGGATRHQWRVDFVLAPAGSDAERVAKAYYAGIFPPDWDGGYDVDRYPSYGPDWRASGRPAVTRLDALGVYEMAARQEAFTGSRRRDSRTGAVRETAAPVRTGGPGPG